MWKSAELWTCISETEHSAVSPHSFCASEIFFSEHLCKGIASVLPPFISFSSLRQWKPPFYLIETMPGHEAEEQNSHNILRHISSLGLTDWNFQDLSPGAPEEFLCELVPRSRGL